MRELYIERRAKARLEKEVERRLREGMKRANGLCDKIKIIGRRGCPDRLCTWPDATMDLVELKKLGKKPAKHQSRDHARRAKCGVQVHVIDSVDGVDRFLRRGNPSAQRSAQS